MRSDFETITVERYENYILLVSLNRPEAANALNTQMALDLMQLFEGLTINIESARYIEAGDQAGRRGARHVLVGRFVPPEAKKRNFEFYDPLTTGDSSLSSCVEAIIAAQVGDVHKAIRYGIAALLMDLADVGGNVKDGCHIASMGGTWMMLTYGLGGMRDHDGTLSFWPRRAPQDNAVLRFPVTYRGKLLQIAIGVETVEYALRDGERLVIHHEAEELGLTRENPVIVRPVSRS